MMQDHQRRMDEVYSAMDRELEQRWRQS
jgi:hypothetical protein